MNTDNQVTTLTAKSSWNLSEQLAKLTESRMTKDYVIEEAKIKEERLKYTLENKIPDRYRSPLDQWFIEKVTLEHDEQVLSKGEAEMKKELGDIMEKSKRLTKEIISINEEIKEKKEELKRENEKFKITVSTQIDKWIKQAHYEGRLTLIVDMALLTRKLKNIKPSYFFSDFFFFFLLCYRYRGRTTMGSKIFKLNA